MSQVSYGTITITDTTDLTTYIRYAKQAPLTAVSQFQETPTTETHYIAVLNIPSSDTIPAWNSTDWKWSEFIGTDGVSVLGTREIYYLKTNSITVTAPANGSDISQASANVENQWTKSVPTYITNGEYWTCIQTHLDGSPTWVYGSPVLNQSLTDMNHDIDVIKSVTQQSAEDAQGAMSQAAATQVAQEALASKLKRIWINEVTSGNYLAGTYAASGINGVTFSESNPSSYGFNSLLRHNYLSFRYNTYKLVTIGTGVAVDSDSAISGVAINVPIVSNGTITNVAKGMELTANTLKFYQPPTISGSTVTDGALAMELSGDALKFYKTDSTIPSMLINTNGIIIGEKQDDSVSDLEKTNYLQLTSSGLSFYGLFNPFSLIPIQRQFGKLLSLGVDSNQLGAIDQNHLYIDKEQTCLGVGDSATWNNAFMRIGSNAASLEYSNYVETYQGVWNTGETLLINYQLKFLGQSPFSRTDGVVIKLDLPDGTSTTFNGATALIELAGTTYAIQVIGTEQVSGLPLRITTTSSGNNPIGSINVTVVLTYNATMYGPRYMFGNGGIPYAPYSMTFGNHTIASSTNQIVMGQYNEPLINAQFIIGNGTSDNDRSNLFIIDSDGNLKVIDGFEIVSSNGNSLALNSTGVEVKYQDKTLAKYGTTTTFYKPDGVTTAATINSSGINIVKGTITLGNKFTVTSDGVLTATDATITGTIVATDFVAKGGGVKRAEVNSNGLTLYDTDGTTITGSFGNSGIVQIGKASTQRVEITSSAVDMYNKNNKLTIRVNENGLIVYEPNDSTNPVAQFLNTGAIIGQNASGKSRTEIKTSGMQIIRNVNGTDTLIAHLGFGEGNIEDGTGVTNTPYYLLGSSPNTSSVSDYDATTEYSQGSWVKYNGKIYIYINQTASTGIPPTNTDYWTYIIGNYSLAQGWHTTAAGFGSVAEGSNNTACGSSAHAEGYACRAFGEHSHAEGYYARSIGKQSHAEGSFTRAYGYAAHVEGHNNNAIGDESHVTGEWNDAGYEDQFVCGKYNKNDSNDLFEVGNGTGLSGRSNALTVNRDGRLRIYPTSAGDAASIAVNYQNKDWAGLLIGSGGINHGLYSWNLSTTSGEGWIIYTDKTSTHVPTGSLYTQGIVASSTVRPSTDGGSALGSSSYKWGNIWTSSTLYKDAAPVSAATAYDCIWDKTSSNNYRLCRPSSSSIRYKKDITTSIKKELDPHNLYKLETKQFRFKEGYFEKDSPYELNPYDVIGFIAEDVEKYYPVACIKIDNEVENWDVRYIVPPMLSLIREQHEEIEQLKNELNTLKDKLNQFNK